VAEFSHCVWQKISHELFNGQSLTTHLDTHCRTGDMNFRVLNTPTV